MYALVSPLKMLVMLLICESQTWWCLVGVVTFLLFSCVRLLTHFGLLQCSALKDGFEWYLTVFILELDLIYESASSHVSVFRVRVA